MACFSYPTPPLFYISPPSLEIKKEKASTVTREGLSLTGNCQGCVYRRPFDPVEELPCSASIDAEEAAGSDPAGASLAERGDRHSRCHHVVCRASEGDGGTKHRRDGAFLVPGERKVERLTTVHDPALPPFFHLIDPDKPVISIKGEPDSDRRMVCGLEQYLHLFERGRPDPVAQRDRQTPADPPQLEVSQHPPGQTG